MRVRVPMSPFAQQEPPHPRLMTALLEMINKKRKLAKGGARPEGYNLVAYWKYLLAQYNGDDPNVSEAAARLIKEEFALDKDKWFLNYDSDVAAAMSALLVLEDL